MSERLTGSGKQTRPQQEPAKRRNISYLWLLLPCVLLSLWAGTALERLTPHFRWEFLPIAAAGIATAIFALIMNRLLLHPTAEIAASPFGEGLKDLFDTASPAVAAIDLSGNLIYCNPAIEQLTGYRTMELQSRWGMENFLAPGEGNRLVAEMQKICQMECTPAITPGDQIMAFLTCIRTLPPASAPSFEAQLRQKSGTFLPITLHISPLRSTTGQLTGMVVVVLDRKTEKQSGSTQQEAKERYQDLIEHTNEMAATLSPAGRFYYVNPAWERHFELAQKALLENSSFTELFGDYSGNKAEEIFHRALNGETIERAALRYYTTDGQTQELEVSLSLRQEKDVTVAVRCLLHDVTQQKQREKQLALQLAVSRIAKERVPASSAKMHILEALCTAQQWDVAILWTAGEGEDSLRFDTAWGIPGRQAESLIQESMGLRLGDGSELIEQAWKEGRTTWFGELAAAPATPRTTSARCHQMTSGWATPVRVAGKTAAVLEFYCHHPLREDRDAMAAIETAAAAIGELIEQAQRNGPANKLEPRPEILLYGMAEGLCGLDHEGKVNYANPAAARLLGFPIDMLAGKPLDELLHGAAPADKHCDEECVLRKAAGKAENLTGETNVYRADGAGFPAEYFLTPLREKSGAAGTVFCFRDISQRSALDQRKDEFISTVSHELRTPLTSIRGALGLLSGGMIDSANKKANHLLHIALTNSERLVRLINDILDLERIQSGREPLVFRPVQLADIVKQAIDDLQPMADAAEVQLIHDSTRVEIAADPDRLLQVMTNLLSNAVKFSPPNSPVSVMLRPGVTGVILSIIDHGRGIPADKLEMVFGRFQQVEASDARQRGGSGLGLAISRSIVEQHAGRIWAERNPVRGSTFRVFLPYNPTPLDEAGDKPEAGANHGPVGTVVLADAHAESRRKIAAQLARHGYSVMQAATVEQTLSAAKQEAAAILLDTTLDGMNGWEILPLLRRQEASAHTPVVLLSVEEQPTGKALPEGAEGLVANPLQEDALLAELARVLRGTGGKARVLIVEDDRDLASIIGEVFTRDDIAVQTAHSCKETIDACLQFQPHLVVLDIGLPDGDGFNVVNWLRQQKNQAQLPLVVYSGRELSPAERQQLTLGPTYFLTKARVQPQQLEALVLTMLRNSRQEESTPPELAVPNS